MPDYFFLEIKFEHMCWNCRYCEECVFNQVVLKAGCEPCSENCKPLFMYYNMKAYIQTAVNTNKELTNEQTKESLL